MDGFGLTGIATIKSAGAVGAGNIIRVYDLAIGQTSGAANIMLFNGSDASGDAYMNINTNVMYQHSDAGFRFEKGCFAIPSGCTATVNFIREF
jgi:hypothetical protein